MNSAYVILILLFPFAAFIINGLFGRKYLRNNSGIISVVLLFISLLLSLITAYNYFFTELLLNGQLQSLVIANYHWLNFTPQLSIDIGLLIDPISVMMLVVITLISFLVHLYSLSYMKGEERYSTYYSFLGLFTFSMLGLIISSNIFQTYIFWELVGVSSYLLIGFYYERPTAVAAAKKAFIVTRFADLGFLTGILILSYYSGSLDFQTLITRFTYPGSLQLHEAVSASLFGASALTWGLALVFVGGAGKSAMFPLHIWLPDAMEGPTPVSALIHAATMVVAGVYLVARLFPVYAISCPAVLNLISVVGIISALFAAIVACTQTDIKRVLAYSTMSQIGFMMFSLGVSSYGGESGLGYMASMFHLFTHALFKALLFLGAGTIIHFIHSNEMNKMGGLNKKLPVSHFTFLIACLAISGIPPFAGFFSKEEILLAAFNSNKIIYCIAVVTSGLTAFYMFRLFYMIFYNSKIVHHNDHHQPEPFAIKFPLLILAAGSLCAGFIPFGKYISSDRVPLNINPDYSFSVLPVSFAVIGIIIATIMFRKKNNSPEKITAAFNSLFLTIKRKFYIDEIYEFITRQIIFSLIAKPAAWIDKNIIDGLVNLSGKATQVLSLSISGFQSGRIQNYAAWMLSGCVIIISGLIYFTLFR